MTPNAAGPDAAEVIAKTLCDFNLPGPTPADYMPDAIQAVGALLAAGFTVMRQDALDALRSEIAALAEKLVAAVEREKVLREALEPFAKAAAAYDPDDGLDDVLWSATDGLRISDLRIARAALTHTAPSERPDRLRAEKARREGQEHG